MYPYLSCWIQWLQSSMVCKVLPGATFCRLLYMLARKKASLSPLITNVGTVIGCPIALQTRSKRVLSALHVTALCIQPLVMVGSNSESPLNQSHTAYSSLCVLACGHRCCSVVVVPEDGWEWVTSDQVYAGLIILDGCCSAARACKGLLEALHIFWRQSFWPVPSPSSV